MTTEQRDERIKEISQRQASLRQLYESGSTYVPPETLKALYYDVNFLLNEADILAAVRRKVQS